ncbi:MAG: F0F1 ATP synthase subunit A [Oscillospiraceae bacterium]|nr:F0F1 ATP synthase subunit A [Oscillospiraceae bacterium]
MNVSVDGAFVYFIIPIFGGIPITQTTVSSFLVTLLLITASIRLGKNLQKRPTGIQVLVEKGVGMIYDLTTSAMGEHNAHWAPFMGTIFLSSICGSLIGLTGFLRSSTADLSCTLTWSIMVSVIIWYNNIKANGFVGWLKGFTEPVAVMTPMNLISEVAQPMSMAFRHFGNVAGGGVITTIIYTAFSMLSALVLNLISASGWAVGAVLLVVGALLLIFAVLKKKKLSLKILGAVSLLLGLFGLLQALGILSDVPILSFGIPAVLSCYFDIFSGFVQALVFTLLTMVYIAGSLPEPQENAQA